MNCVNCGASVAPGASHCRKCGSVVESPAQVPGGSAQVAGQQSPVNVVIQVGSGTVPGVPQLPMTSAAPKSRIAAGVLGIVLGFLGVHRFYLGYTGIGLVQLLLTILTCGWGSLVTAPWGVIEGILILVGKINQDAWGRPLDN